MTRHGIGGEVRSGAGCGRNAGRDINRKQPLAKIIGFARIEADDRTQRPLQEQQNHDRQRQPFGRSKQKANDLIQESHVLLAPMLRDSRMSDWREYSRFLTAVTRLTPARQAAHRQMANAKPAITGAETKSAASAVGFISTARNGYLISGG